MNYSDRPNSYLGQIITGGEFLTINSNTKKTQQKRKMITQAFTVCRVPTVTISDSKIANVLKQPSILDGKSAEVQEAECVTPIPSSCYILC